MELKRKFIAAALSICPAFVIDDNNRTDIQNLFNYFLGFSDCNLDLRKGIMLMGTVGTGKTDLMTIFAKFTGRFRITESRIIVREYMKDGVKGLERWSYNYELNQHGVSRPKPFELCIDDFGLEREEAGNFGNRQDVMSELMADRYQIFRNQGIKTHAITNLARGLESKYDERLNDRFREMFNVVKLTGNSRRK